MPGNISVENNFIGGLKTEFTGLNAPENSCSACDNVLFSIIGDAATRNGFNYENGAVGVTTGNPGNQAVSIYKWNNAGGDGQSQIVVVQLGSSIGFFLSSNSTGALSATLMVSTIFSLNSYIAPGGSTANIAPNECQFSDGNGYLFVFHPFLTSFYVQFTPPAEGGPAITTSSINLQIRDLAGLPEPGNPLVNARPNALTNEHSYNLQNQGWTNLTPFSIGSTTSNLTIAGNTVTLTPGSYTYAVSSTNGVANGDTLTVTWSVPVTYTAVGDGSYTYPIKGTSTATVTSFVANTSITVTVSSSSTETPGTGSSGITGSGTQTTLLSSSNILSTITTFDTAVGFYPSNADIWWEFKDTTGTFNPGTTVGEVPLSSAQAPQGHFLLDPFNQQRSNISGISSITPITTTMRPSTGAFFAGRVWYSGVNAGQAATGDVPFYSWTENIYFSQIVNTPSDFGNCYQENDPTDDTLFALLPTDGGVLTIQGTGAIYKLFVIQNGLLVFATNGIWIIRGDSGLGFTADDYVVSKISGIQSISGTSIVDVLGLPMFWNHEGIYHVTPTQGQAPYGFGGFDVQPLTVGTILTFYNNIPYDSKRFAKGTYDPINYIVKWTYRSTQESGLTNRYLYDSILNFNIFNKAFYPYSIAQNGQDFIMAPLYVNYPTGTVNPTTKYLTGSTASGTISFSEENDDVNWVDWADTTFTSYNAFMTTQYKVHGKGYAKWMPIYVHVYSRNVDNEGSYTIQGIWDYATSTSTNRYQSTQLVTNPLGPITLASGASWPTDIQDYAYYVRRHKIRGHGLVLQINFTNVAGKPFDIIGWSIPEQINQMA